jgi:hypothetical protein
VISAWHIGLKIWVSNFDDPCSHSEWNSQVPCSVVRIQKPLEFVLCQKIHTKLRPLEFKLEAIVEDEISKSDVLVPGVRVSDKYVSCFLYRTTTREMCLLGWVCDQKGRSVLPLNQSKEELQRGDVDVWWNIVMELGKRRKTRHGATDNFLSAFVESDNGRFDNYLGRMLILCDRTMRQELLSVHHSLFWF